MRSKTITSVIMVLVLSFSTTSCITLFGGSTNTKKTDKNVKKLANRLNEDIKPPVKSYDIVQGESDILKMASEDLNKAKGSLTRDQFDKYLHDAQEKLRLVMASIGLSPSDTNGYSKFKKKRVMEEFREDLVKSKEENYNYLQAMQSYKIETSDLRETLRKHKSFIYWMWWGIGAAILATVLIMAFVPGGSFFMRRFWTSGFKVAHGLASTAYESLTSTVQGLNQAMDRPEFNEKPQGSDRTYKEIITESIERKSKDTTLVDQIKTGRNHLDEMKSQIGKQIKKVIR